MLKRQYDAGFTWSSGQGNVDEGYSRGTMHSMVAKGELKMSDLRILWRSRLIPNGPLIVRKALPADFKALLSELLINLKSENPQAFQDMSKGAGQGLVKVDHSFYEPVIEMVKTQAEIRRGG